MRLRDADCGLRELVAIAVGVAVVGACAAEGAAEATVRDSAGVRIVENSVANSELPEFTVDSVPRTAIGVLDGDEAYQLDGVTGSVLQGDRIMIANGGSRELRVFDLEGRHIATGGRQGGGPGEFENIDWLGRVDGDSVIVYDRRNLRFSIFDLDATLVRSITAAEGFFGIAGRFADGGFLISPSVSFSSSDAPRNGLVRDSSRIIRVLPSGSEADTLMVLIGTEIILHHTPARMSARLAPFGRVTRVAVGDTVFHTVTSDTYEIRTWNRDGRLLRVLRRSIEPAAVSGEDIDRLKAEELEEAQSDNQRRELEKTLAEMPYPDRMAALGRLHVDDDGYLWVQDYSPWEDEPTKWTIFDEEGRAVGRARLPARLVLHQIGSDFVLGMREGELDVEQVVLLRLERTPSDELAADTRDTPHRADRR